MILAGYIKIDNELSYVLWKDIKATECFWAFSPYHVEDRFAAEMGATITHPVIRSQFVLDEYYNDNYLLGILKRTKISGKISVWGNNHVNEVLLDTLAFAKNYKFAKADVRKDTVSRLVASNNYSFDATDRNLVYQYERDDMYFQKLYIKYSGVEIKLESFTTKLSETAFELTDANRVYSKKILTKTIKDIDYNTLCDSLDMTWYRDGDVFKKDYQTIESMREFELKIMTPLIKAIKQCETNNTKLNVSVDTETTGLNVYDLKPDNPDKDHVVAIPIAWEINKAFVIFTDMEHFSNVDNDYAVSRLAEIFEKFTGDREIEYWEEDTSTNSDDLLNMNLFGEDNSKVYDNELKNCKKIITTINRDNINLVGHNVMFDKKAFIDSDRYFYFDDDTMQMSFNLCSKLIKGSNKLKNLTRKLFGHETPELTDILGKGNEDKYRFLSDKETAAIYGCADADYTLQVFLFLVKLMSPEMYENYHRLDVPLLNILPHSEYCGLRINEEEAFKLGDIVYKDIEILKQFAYRYVGIFINYYKQRQHLEAKKTAGLLSEEEFVEAINSINIDNSLIYEFEFKPNELRKVLFEILKYPIKAWTTGNKPQPKLDKYALKKLISEERSTESTDYSRLEMDIISSGITRDEYNKLREKGDSKSNKKADAMCLISASKFNKCKYPLALILQKYAELNKEYTAYYKPMKETNLEGKIFKSYSLARIETRRIQNAAQTMKGNLKALVQPYNDDYYLLDFDMSQVEYRIMLSLAKHYSMIERMKDPEKDYHTETASLINAIPAHKVGKDVRKKAKGVSFGVPYGLGERSLSDNLFGNQSDDSLFNTRLLLSKWEKANKPIMDFLNAERDNALIAREMSTELRDFIDGWERDDSGNYALDEYGNRIKKPTGFIYNKYGFYRIFDLKDVEQTEEAKRRRASGKYTSAESKIRRPAGNFPIQCFAAELFRIILIRFHERCIKEGIADKVIWHMLIHDELLCSVHKSVHPFLIYKIVKESCMVTMKEHTKYFVGINIGKTWGDVKNDEREAPVYFVDRIIKRWDAGEFGEGPFWFDDPWNEIIKPERAKYVGERINEVIHQIQPNIDNEPIDIPKIMERFDNYTVRSYVEDYDYNSFTREGLSKKDLDKPEIQDKLWASKFETWALDFFEEGKPLINFDGKLTVLRKYSKEQGPVEELDDLDLSLLFDDDDLPETESDYWSFDINECSAAYESDIVDDSEEEDIFMYDLDTSKTDAHNIADMLMVKNRYKHINVMLEQVIINIPTSYCAEVKHYLENSVSNSGKTVVFNFKNGGAERWLKITDSFDWAEFDEYLDELTHFELLKITNSKYKARNFKQLNDNLVIILKNKNKFFNCESWLREFESSRGYSVILKSPLGDLKKLPFKVAIELERIDCYLDKEI